jgi:glycosyltransferase involved in cell wall biosynthesis
MPRVSVIVNAHNGARTLAATLDSILAQTFGDFEIVFWDDGSVDDTARIARACTDPRLRCHQSPGGRAMGLGPARQAAVAVAQGEWIAFIDQDDLWLPHTLELQLARVGDEPRVGMVYGRAIRFWPDGRERDFDHRHEFCTLPEGDLFRTLWIDSCFICISATLLRREALIAIGDMPPAIRTVPDYFYFLGIARHWQVRAVQQVVCRYRMHAGNLSNGTRGRMQIEVLALIDRWQGDLEPALADRRRRVHSTVLAVDEIRRRGLRRAGLRRLWTEGSVLFLLSRPPAWAARELRRRLAAPFWRQAGMAA